MVHKKGCNCKNNVCNKKYCVCFSAGVKCSSLCQCGKCQNGKSENIEIIDEHLNVEGSNFVDIENYSKGNVVSIKT